VVFGVTLYFWFVCFVGGCACLSWVFAASFVVFVGCGGGVVWVCGVGRGGPFVTPRVRKSPLSVLSSLRDRVLAAFPRHGCPIKNSADWDEPIRPIIVWARRLLRSDSLPQ